MKPKEINSKKKIVVIGTFDGVHRGHRTLINAAADYAKLHNLDTEIFSFSTIPANFFGAEILSITTSTEKLKLLENMDCGNVKMLPFDERTANNSPQVFIDSLKKLGACAVASGHDFRFGAGASGDAEFFKKSGFSVIEVEPVRYEDEPISSSRIRLCLLNGDLCAANEMLGYEYLITGEVIHGRKIGATLGLPTANFACNADKQYPKIGVYAGHAEVDGTQYSAMINVGSRPTFGVGKLNIETHIIGEFSELYGKTITVSFTKKLRNEMKFSGKAELKNQLEKDRLSVTISTPTVRSTSAPLIIT